MASILEPSKTVRSGSPSPLDFFFPAAGRATLALADPSSPDSLSLFFFLMDRGKRAELLPRDDEDRRDAGAQVALRQHHLRLPQGRHVWY